ncbi:hypothetical protein BC834DRAFT_790426, partial [Gloeopeniophorella convolvens]
LSLDGMLYMHVQDHPITGEDFRDFVWGVLQHMSEWPLPNSVLIVDNASIHKVDGI